jgi:hypothetical protein
LLRQKPVQVAFRHRPGQWALKQVALAIWESSGRLRQAINQAASDSRVSAVVGRRSGGSQSSLTATTKQSTCQTAGSGRYVESPVLIGLFIGLALPVGWRTTFDA